MVANQKVVHDIIWVRYYKARYDYCSSDNDIVKFLVDFHLTLVYDAKLYLVDI